MPTKYERDIQNRTKIRYLKGLYPRFKKYVINSYITWTAKRKGATIGQHVTMPYKLAKRANRNLSIGDHTSIQTELIDLRIPIKIGNHVIIGSEVEIITVSHQIDSIDWEHKNYGLEIKDYSWLATRAFILPSCREIGYGSVCAAGSVIAKNVDRMAVMVGNPAQELRKRKEVHSALCVESLQGNDFVAYRKARKERNETCL